MANFALLAIVFAVFACSATAQQVGGATSVKDLVNQLIGDYNKASAQNLPAYDSVGSGKGITGFIGGSYAIGVSDNPLTAAQLLQAKSRGISTGTFPFTLSTYSMVTNNGGLSLKACQIANIYLGRITRWEQISNSKRTGTIIPLMRSTSSGTTEVFTTYLKKACSSWPSKFVGTGPYETGNPNLFKVSGSDAMASKVATDNRALGYVQTNYGVVKYGNKEVLIQNKANKQVSAASSDPYQSIPRQIPTSFKSWSGVDLIYVAGAKTFPMVSFVYMFARGSYKGKSYGKNVKLFMKYLMSYKGQLIASTYYFSPIPSKVTKINNKGIEAIKA